MKIERAIPRIIIAGTGGDSGKTIVSMGLAASWKRHGLRCRVFKKGPDYIDSAWLSLAAGEVARNLDTYTMGVDGVKCSFTRNSTDCDICIIEGNRGIHDGFDARGTHSTAELAKLLKAPVILVVDVTKVTRTVAAIVLGCMRLDPDVNIVGVIINRAAGARHEKVVRESVESLCGIHVLGAIPKLKGENILPGRHLGLETPQEHRRVDGLCCTIADIIEKYIDTGRILDMAKSAPSYETCFGDYPPAIRGDNVRIGYFRDSAFNFYYQDNLDAISATGAELVPISSLHDKVLPPCDGLLIGGGFPETHAGLLAKNISLLESVRKRADEGFPVYAECGGLIYLCRSLKIKGEIHRFAGVFPLDLEMMQKSQGHGYTEALVDIDNPYFPQGTILRGHEFHYTRIMSGMDKVKTAYSIRRGTGCFDRRDGIFYKNVLASYTHLHAMGAPQWVDGFVNLIKSNKNISDK